MPVIALLALLIQVSCQLFKFVFYSIRDRRVEFHYLVTAGGYPSAHSAFVSSLTTLIGFRFGFEDVAFSVALVFALIVIYDAFRLRGHVQQHAVLLNKLISDKPELAQHKQSEMVGHSMPEILSGVAFGVLASLLMGSLVYGWPDANQQ